jgi:Transposase IS116/IS110/IS902 family
MAPGSQGEFAAVVGLDWADAKPDSCFQATGPERREFMPLAHRPAAIAAWGCTLRTRFNGQPVAGGLELKKGPLVSALRPYACLGLFPVHPLTLARDRAALTPSRAKDAPTDAALQGERLLTHRDKRTPRTPQSPTMRALAPLVAPRRRLGGAKVRRTHRLPRTLKNSFPHVLQCFAETETPRCCACLRHWPTLKAAQRARRSTLESVFRAHRVRSADLIANRIQALKRAIALTTEDGVIPPHALLGQARVAQLRVTLQAVAACDNALAQYAQGPPAFPWFDALPGAGAVFAPRLLVAFGDPRERDTAAEALHKYAGMAPGTERSGKKAWGPWRFQGPKCLRQPCVAWAAASLRHAFWARVY